MPLACLAANSNAPPQSMRFHTHKKISEIREIRVSPRKAKQDLCEPRKHPLPTIREIYHPQKISEIREIRVSPKNTPPHNP